MEQELRPILEGMAGLIGCKVWYVTEKGELEVRISISWVDCFGGGVEGGNSGLVDPSIHPSIHPFIHPSVHLHVIVMVHALLQVVPKVLEAEQREIDEMRALMDAGAWEEGIEKSFIYVCVYIYVCLSIRPALPSG